MHNHKSVIFGAKAENFFASELNKLGLEYNFADKWYDFLVNKTEKVEVKSCTFSQKRNKGFYSIGRFDFTKKENREKQYDSNIWVCFILRHGENFLLLGFCKAKELKQKRYISLHKLHKLNLINMKEWIQIINN